MSRSARVRGAVLCSALSCVAVCLGGLPGSLAAEESLLADAAMQRDMAAVRALVREGADPDTRGAYGTPPLVWVVRVGDHETVDVLLAAGADPDLATPLDLAPLHLAVTHGDSAIVHRLLAAGANPNLADGAGETPLMLAARTGSLEIAAALLDAGAEIEAKEPRFQQTALHVAAREGTAEMATLLLARGADVAARTLAGEVPGVRLPADNAGSKGVGIVRGGWPERGMRYAVPGAKTPLLYASRRGDLAMVRAMLDAGADIEQPDANGVTPLLNTILNASVASAGRDSEHFVVATYLIDAGADVNAVDWYGETPLWAAVDVRNLDVTGPMRENGIDRAAALELIERLIEAGAQVDARTREYPPERRFITRLGSLSWVDFTGQTAFLRAALAGDVTVMRLLLEHGADANIPTFGGTTPLMAAAGVNWVVNQTFDEGPQALLAAVELAHRAGNEINAVNSMGLAAVHGAANRGSNDIIRYLAANGAVLDGADNEGRTPLAWAAGVFLATHPPVRKPETIALLESLLSGASL